MKGYTIQNSINLLEKKAGSGSGGASTAAEVSFDNTDTGLVATNVQGALGEIDNRFAYSTTEKAVGKWTDGSTLYETTVHINALPAAVSTGTDYPHGIANIDKIIGISGIISFPGGNVSPIPYVISKADAIASQIGLVVNTTNIVINVGTDRSGCSADVTLRYLKTASEAKSTRKKSSK